MKNLTILFFSVLCLSAFWSCQSEQVERPNIIFIMADDLGYGELGAYGQDKIETPNLDALAAKGMKFNQFYTGSPVCAPSRCILLTGQHSGRSYIRGNDELRHRGDVWNYKAMAADSSLEGQYPLADSIITVAERLQTGGYHTALFGKWGLGYPGSESSPNSQGFDYFYGYNCQRQAHTLTPLHLWRNDVKVHLNNDTIPPRTKLLEGADPYDLSSYDMYNQPDYAPTHIFNDLISHIDDNIDEPFAFFWESPIPHVPLQAPKKWVDHYVKKFGDEQPYIGDYGYFPCRYPNATYAGMISYLDENIGKLVTYLKENDLFDNTVIFFTSDNGPTYAGGVDASYFDSAQPFRSDLGWGKGYVREGGIRVPLIVSWPDAIPEKSISNHISSSQDIYPTICDIAGINYDDADIDGISFIQNIEGKSNQPTHDYLYWEFPEGKGQVAVRKGDFKAFLPRVKEGNTDLELYNLDIDPLETTNIAADHPEMITEMNEIIKKEHVTSFHTRWQMKALDK